MAGRAVDSGRSGFRFKAIHIDRVTVAAAAAAAFVMLTTLAFAASGNPEIGAGYEFAADVLKWARQHLEGIVAAAYDRAPALVMVLAAMFIIPLIALLALLAHALRLKLTLRRPPRAIANDNASPIEAMPIPTPLLRARLLIDGQRPTPLPSGPTLVRIGRHEDNDIRLAHASVHRHHALIHRTSDDEYVIVDLSGRDGNGILVNGHRMPEARLAAGDEIVLGTVALRFETAA